MPASLTVTGKIGPGNSLSAKSFTNISIVSFHTDAQMLRLFGPQGVVTDIDMSASTTSTITYTGTTYTVVVA